MKSYGLCQDMGHLDFEVRRPEFLWNCDFVEIAQGAIQICEDCLDGWRDLLDDFIKGDCQYSPDKLEKQPMPQIPFIERYGDENYYLSLVALKRLRRKYFKEVHDSEGFCCIDCARDISLEESDWKERQETRALALEFEIETNEMIRKEALGL